MTIAHAIARVLGHILPSMRVGGALAPVVQAFFVAFPGLRAGDSATEDAPQVPAPRRIATAMKPRLAITFGIPVEDPPLASRVLAVDAPDDPAPRKRLTLVQGGPDALFARPSARSRSAPKAERMPTYFDLAVIGARYDDETARSIVRRLKPLAHAHSTILLMREPGASLPGPEADAAVRVLASTFDGIDIAAVAGRAPAALASGLDLARPRAAEDAQDHATVGDEAEFIERFRIRATTGLAEATPVPDAPSAPAAMVRPAYRDIGGAADIAGTPLARSEYWIGNWWGARVAIPAVGVTVADDVGFVVSDGHVQMTVIDRDGTQHRAAWHERGGYGRHGDRFVARRGAVVAIDDADRRFPIGNAARLLDGRRVSGDFYLLGHVDRRFGHLLTEGLSRAWALDWALSRGMRILAWDGIDALNATLGPLIGLDPARIEAPLPGAVYERVYMPDRALRLLGIASPAMAPLWQRIADRALAAAPDETFDARFLYLSRSGVTNRRLVNEAALEAELALRGGRIVRPEQLPFPAQVRLAARARTIVGCTGSQLHLSMFARPGTRKLVIGHRHFLGPDETLIGIANGSIVDHYVEPLTTVHADPMQASWAIDLDRFLPAFDRWLAEGDARD